MKKWRNKILSAVLVLSLLLTSSSFAFAVGEDSTAEENIVQIPQEQLEIAGFSSQQFNPSGNISQGDVPYKDEGPATNAIDGNYDNFWHTIWTGTDSTTGINNSEDREKYIIIDLGKPVYLKQIKVYQRQNSGDNNRESVRIKDYGVYLSLEKETFSDFSKNPEMSGSFENTAQTNILTFKEPVYTQYVKFRDTDWEKEFATLAELEFFEDTSISKEDVPTITTQPVSQEVNNLNDASLTVTAGNANSYQWYKTPDGTLNSGVAIESATNNSYVPTEEGYYFVKITSENSSYIFSNIVEVSLYEAQIENTGTKGSLAEMISQATDGQTISILTDINLDTALNISKNITIKTSNTVNEPYTIKRASGVDGVMFTVETTGNLTLDNIIIDGGADWGDFTPAENGTNSGKKGGSIIEVSGSGQLTVNSGAILQNNENIVSAGGAIKADSPNAKVHVYGKIWNNRTTGNTTNTWNNGGGIATNGKIYIYDGAVISGNNATVKSGAGVGGAIQVYGDGSLNIYGGTIENNKAGSGDNIGHSSSAPINLSGNFNIENINVNTISNKINIVDYVAENSSITIICNSITDGTKVAAIDEGVDTTNIVNAIKVDGKTTYRSGNDVKVGQAAKFTGGGLDETKTVMLNPNGNTSTTLTVETTGTDVTYEWYSCEANGDNPQLMEGQITDTLTLDNLTIGSTYYYCVIDNGDESTAKPKTSTICEVKVSDFYPCSKAIEKFKSI